MIRGSLTGPGRGQATLPQAERTPEDSNESDIAEKTIAVNEFTGEHSNGNLPDVQTRGRTSGDVMGSLQSLMR